MLRRIFFAVVVVLLCAAAAGAQTKVTSVGQCAKPEVEHSVPIAGWPNHAFAISQAKCTYTKPTEIEGVKATEGTGWQTGEVSGDSIRYHGYYEEAMSNGDKVLYRYEGKGTMKDGAFQGADETWSVIRGTGALKGLHGKGTCRAKGNADGSTSFECEGEVTVAAKPAKKGK